MRFVAFRRAERLGQSGERRKRLRRPGPTRMVVLAVLAAHGTAMPATITVGGACSLADAIRSANTDAAVGGCTAGSGADTIVLAGPVTLTAELPAVSSQVVIDGNGHAITRDEAAPAFRIIAFTDAVSAVLRNTTISNGIAGFGGGVLHDVGYLDVIDTRIVGNQASFGGGIGSTLFASGLTLVNSTIADNHASHTGGGLYATYFYTLIEGSTIANNTAGVDGGGVSTQAYATTVITNSTISGNAAADDGGGLHNAYKADDMTLISTTIVGNTAAEGGGVSNQPFAGDTALNVENSIIAGNMGGNCAGGNQHDLGGNFDDDGSCLGAAAIVAGVDFDAMLADNGGPTLTHALLPGSVAVDAAGECGLAIDQRGFAREPPCDSGSVELGAAPVGGSIALLEGRRATCRNLTTGAQVAFVLASGATSWSCEEQGLEVAAGDFVRQIVGGVSSGGAGGAVIGLAARSVSCINVTTGQSVDIDLSSGPSWDCVAAGLAVSAGDRLRMDSLGAVF